jgi:uncharacterized membrane protein
MKPSFEFLSVHWFPVALLMAALILGAFCLRKRTRWLLVLGVIFASIALGSLALPSDWAGWLAAGAGVVIFVKLILLLTTGRWWPPVATAAALGLLLAFGSLFAEAVGHGLADAWRIVLSLEPVAPWWLLCLGFIPLIVYFSFRSLAGLGPVRRWLAIGLRCLLVLFLTLALAEVRIRHQNDSVTVLFLLDRTLSIPEELEADPKNPGKQIDRRWERIKQFINDAVEKRNPGHERDKAGLIVFGRRPHLELPASDVPQFHFSEISSNVNGNYTDIGAAIKLALASFPEGTGKRIVLISDGNENLGNAEEQARIARTNGVQIDVVPLAAGYRNENEVLVQAIEAPANIEQGSQLPIRVLVRSYNPRTVWGTLTVKQVTEGEAVLVPPSPVQNVRLQPGLNSFSFKQSLATQQQSYSYEATFQPEFVESDAGGRRRLLPGEDRVQNNRATTHVVARGQSRVLIVEAKVGEEQFLIDQIRGAGDGKFKVHAITVDRLPLDKGELGIFLSNYDCVVLANVPADALNDEQQEMIRSNTYDQGCGLVMIGGPEGFGAGGWQNTAVEKALPVDSDIKSVKVQGKAGLVLIMHASEMAEGNRWQKIVAKLAIKKLSPIDMFGMIYYHWGKGGHDWHIKFQQVAEKRDEMIREVDSMSPGDMPDVDPAFQKAYDELTKAEYDLAARLIILISDGDHWQESAAMLAKLRAAKIPCTTVCVTSHGVFAEQRMAQLARATGGRAYAPRNPNNLPAIYTKETRLISRSFIYEKKFTPRLAYRSGPTERLPDPLEPLYGFVRTTRKENPLVETPIVSPRFADQEEFPILAYWHYGLGKGVAFTSDARNAWDKDWAASAMYGKFWEQVLDWSLRPVESKKMTINTEYRDGKVRIIVDARDEKNRPITDLKLRAGITAPGMKADDLAKMKLKFEQKNSGIYEAEVKAEEAGSYFINAQATRTVKVKGKDGKETEVEEGVDSVRSGVTIPYSPEFADLESNTALTEKLRDMTGGQSYADDAASLAEAASSKELFRPGPVQFRNMQPIWYWLVFLAGVGLFFDVALRRIAINPSEVAEKCSNLWERLRGRLVLAAATPQFFDRLKSRKAAISEEFGKAKAAKRFEAQPGAATGPPPDVLDQPAKPIPRPTTAPKKLGPEGEKKKDDADAMSRLLKAKKRIQEERDKGKPE